MISRDVWLWEACNYCKLECLSRAQPKSMRIFVCFITADAQLLKPVLVKSLDSFSYCWSPEVVTQNCVMSCRTSSMIWISEYIIWSRVWRSRSNSSGRVKCKQMKQWVVASGPSPWWNWMKVPLCTAGPISLKQNVIVNGELMYSAFQECATCNAAWHHLMCYGWTLVTNWLTAGCHLSGLGKGWAIAGADKWAGNTAVCIPSVFGSCMGFFFRCV